MGTPTMFTSIALAGTLLTRRRSASLTSQKTRDCHPPTSPTGAATTTLPWSQFRWTLVIMRQHVAVRVAGLTWLRGVVNLSTLSAGLGLRELNTERRTRLDWFNLRYT